MISLINIFRKLMPNKNDFEVKCFCKVYDCDGSFDRINRGVSCVPLNSIVGSVGKCLDFKNNFRPKSHVQLDRMTSIKRVMLKGKSIPPILLYKINGEYYVLDGNNRIAAANELGRSNITAKIIELIPNGHSCNFSNKCA